MNKLRMICGCLLLGLVFACSAKADEISDMKKQIADLQARLDQLEAQQKKVVAEEVNKAIEQKQVSALPENAKWIENMKISGDLRYRYEGIDSQTKGKWSSKGESDSIERNRLRARIGIYDKINDEVDVGFRLGSGSNGDPTSTNQTEGDAFSKKPIWLDQAYFDWHPKDITGFDFIGGKMVNPFYRVGTNELIWDVDLNPEGLAAKYELPINDSLKAYINGGGFWVGNPDNVDTSAGASTSLWGIQSYLKNTFEDKSYLLGGMSLYTYGNIKGEPNVSSTWGKNSFFGNTSVNGTYKYGYDIVEGFAEYGTKIADFPVAVFGDVAHNTDAPSGKNNGWLIGTIFNKAKDPGSWQIGYDYRDIESDAVAGQFNYSDFDGGGTNAKGHQFNFVYQLAKNFQTCLTYLIDENRTTNDKYRRLQADLVFKF
ncbi:MAG: putative porin [Sedimentisphaerales bacterium]